MLDEFSNDQAIAHKILKNAVKKNKVSHAYLIETNGYSKAEDLAISFAKYLLCPKNYSNSELCSNCFQCENIDKNIFSELKIIRPEDGSLWIKKEQLIDLQEEFASKSLLSNKKIYIITDASKLNVNASNSLLKFIEEPNDNIIGILLVDNIHQLLPTIVSRCQIISLSKSVEEINDLNSLLSINVEDSELIKDAAFKFVNYIEKNKEQGIVYTKKLFHDVAEDRSIAIALFETIILYYKDILNKKINCPTIVYENVDSDLLELNTISMLNEKIKIILNLKQKLYYNVNIPLLVDKLIIELGGVK